MAFEQGIRPDEHEIRGGHSVKDGRVVVDGNTDRIRKLRRNHLRLVVTSDDGWSALYLDPADERLWELTFPESGVHGGGPPVLTVVTEQEARSRFQY